MTIDVIEVADGAGTEMVRRIPPTGSGEFKLGAQVIVRESQIAIFVRDGKALDTFLPGRHTLSTLNMPLIGERVTDRIFGQSPFKAEVYFVNTNIFLNLKWGTRDPIAYRDRELAVVRLRAHGEMAVRVSDPVLFVNAVVGARGIYQAKEVEGFLKSIVLSSLAQSVGSVLETIFDLAGRYDELSVATKARVYDEFARYGTELVEFVIEAITPPDDVQARIDERSGMGAVGDLEQYLRYKSALALGEAATHPGNAGGAMDMAVGLGLGTSLMKAAQEGVGPHLSDRSSVTLDPTLCGHLAPANSRFCPECGWNLGGVVCHQCRQPVPNDAKFCPHCGSAASAIPNDQS